MRTAFIKDWESKLQDENRYPSLRTYRLIKKEFKFEPYLDEIKKHKFRVAVSKLRAGSHLLQIERGRYTSPITPRENRRCKNCINSVEDEFHFMIICDLYNLERIELFSKINATSPAFASMDNSEKFCYLFVSHDARVLSWVGKFIHKCMIKRIALYEI